MIPLSNQLHTTTFAQLLLFLKKHSKDRLQSVIEKILVYQKLAIFPNANRKTKNINQFRSFQYCTSYVSLHYCYHSSTTSQITIYGRQKDLTQYSRLIKEICKEQMIHTPLFSLSLQISFLLSLYQLFQIFVVLFPQKSPPSTILNLKHGTNINSTSIFFIIPISAL